MSEMRETDGVELVEADWTRAGDVEDPQASEEPMEKAPASVKDVVGYPGNTSNMYSYITWKVMP